MTERHPPEYLQLAAGEDAASVRDRLSFWRGRPVLLIWPESGTALTRRLDLVLIQREAMRKTIRLALLTHDSDVIRHAADLNISTFETLRDSEREKWRRGRSRVFATRLRRPGAAVDLDELMEYASRLRDEDEHPRQRIVRVVVRIAALLLLIMGSIAAALLIVPGAVIEIAPARQQVLAETILIADPNMMQTVVDVEGGIIPALILRAEVEERGTIPTTGAQEISVTPALGTITLINRSTQPVEVLGGSLVSTSAGTPVVFRTLEAITLAAGDGQQAEVTIEAIPESAGEIGNVAAGLINTLIGPQAAQVEVRNFAPTFGGQRTGVRIVTADDRERLLGVLRQQIQERAFRELAPRLTDNQFMIAETVRIVEERADWQTFDYSIGQAADNLTLTMRATVSITAIDQTLAQQVAYARLSQQIQRGREILPDTLRYQRGSLQNITADGRVTFAFTGHADVQAQIDNALTERIAGMPLADATAYLTRELDLLPGSTPVIRITPFALPVLPVLPFRIQIIQAGS